MKEIVEFYLGDKIPSNAKFITAIKEIDAEQPSFFYEVPIASDKKAVDNETESLIDRAINYLNNKTGSKYSTKTKKHRDLIRARIGEGAKADDFKSCIDNMAKAWLNDEKMSKYLRPDTLFTSKFWSYVNHRDGESMTDEAMDELDRLINGDGNA